ncbi:unnamed protein product [Larinioides sclopetarius]|uniref:Cytochrome P450 n=1 Tax=Larinioides sclopetarius TaxID=280406 RepID=A0AAV2AKU8_9ARAC
MNFKDLWHSKIENHLDVVGVVLATLIVVLFSYKWYNYRRYKLPPGPWGVPFLGYFPFLSKSPFKDFKKLAEKYGNIFRIKLGGADTIILDDFESVKEAFNNPVILDRPANMFDFIPNGLGFAGHNGSEWIEQRRFAMKTLKDIGIGRIAWESSLESEVEDFVQILEQQGGKPFDLYEPLSTSVSNNITSIILGKPLLRGDPRRAIVDGGIEGAIMSFGSNTLTSIFPFLMQFLSKLGLSSHANTFKKLSDFHNFIKSEVERRKKIPSAEWNEEIFIDGYLKEIEKNKEKRVKTWFNENNLTGSSQALLIGGSDTSRTFLCWIFLAMATHPEVQKNVQKEIDAVLGKDGKLNWSGRAKLPYTYAAILETHRWRTITPLGVTHW